MAETLDVTSMLPAKFEPMLKNRFVFAIEGIDMYLIKKAARPTYTTGEKTIRWINATRYVAGRTEFGTIDVSLHEAIAPSASQQVMEWIRLCYESVSGRAGYADFYKRDCQIKMLDGPGTVVQQWDYKGCFVTSANFGDVDYESDDLSEITMTLRFDNAALLY